MATSGKKGKGKKRVTLALNEFLANTENTSSSTTSRLIPRKSGNWADECEDDDILYRQKVVLPSGPRATWGPDIDDNKIPKSPPFLAFISNLPYEVEEEEIEEFFKDLKIVGVRLPRDERPGKLRGFGYVEFETRNCLISALSLPDTTIKGRRIRIEVAAENDRRRGRDSMRDRGYDSERSGGDWRSGPREGPLGEAERRGTSFMSRDRDGFDRSGPRREFGSGGFRDGFDRDRGGGFRDGDRGGFRDGDRGGFRDGDRGGFRDGDRGGFRDGERGGFRDGDRGGFRDGDRGGFRDGERGGFRDGERGGFRDGDRGGFRDGDRGGFRDGDRGGFRDGERERGWERDTFSDRDRGRFNDRDGFGPRRDFGGGRDRDSFRSEGRDELPPEKGEPRARPRLNLQPRTKPVDETAPTAPTAASAAVTVTSSASIPAPAAPASGAPASIFGGAKPVDTAARERIIEERLARERGDMPRSEKNDDGRFKDGDRPPTRRVEPSAPPRENFWSQRSRQNGPPDNGRASPHSDHSDRDSKQDQEESREYRNRPESPEGQYSSRDRQHRGRSGSQRSAYEHDQQSYDEEQGQTGSQEESGGEKVPPSRGNDRERPKGKDSRIDRDRPEDKDEQLRMPKYHEQEAPNFAGSNKFEYLHDEDHE